MELTFHGVRGSTPCHGPATQRYGGNTSCVAVDIPGEAPLLFDLGTGLRYFGLGQPCDGTFVGTCLLTHLHWDHAQGLPFFTPLLAEGAELTIYGPRQADGRSVHEVLNATVGPPMFPLHLDELPGTIRVVDVGNDEFMVGGVRVISRLIPHIGPTLGYRIEWAGRSVAYLSDHQQPADGTLAVSDEALELCRGVDVLIHDAQYTPEEFAVKSTWGHCTVRFAIEVATLAAAKTLVLYHHDPMHHDAQLDAQHAEAVAAAAHLRILTAGEGMSLTVG